MERKKGKQQRKEKKLSFFNLIEQRILYFERLDKKKTASNYICAFKHFKRFRGDQDIAIEDLTVGQMKDFQSYLIGEGLRMNTISLYNRELRAVYNYALDEEYLIEIQVMNGLDIVGSFEVDNVSIPTGIENVTFNRPLALFKDGGWVFRNLQGYAVTVADLSGHIIARYHVNSTAEYHYLELSQGIYIVFGDNKDKKVSFKIIIK